MILSLIGKIILKSRPFVHGSAFILGAFLQQPHFLLPDKRNLSLNPFIFHIVNMSVNENLTALP